MHPWALEMEEAARVDRDGKAKPPNREPEATGMSVPALTNPHKLEEVGLVTAIQAGVWFVSPDLSKCLGIQQLRIK